MEGEGKVEGILEMGMRAKVRGAVWVNRLTGRDMVWERAIGKNREESNFNGFGGRLKRKKELNGEKGDRRSQECGEVGVRERVIAG